MSSMVKLINLVINANCSIRNFSFVSCNNYNLRFWNHTGCAKLQLNRLLVSDDRFNTQTFCSKSFFVKIRYDLWEYFLSLIKNAILIVLTERQLCDISYFPLQYYFSSGHCLRLRKIIQRAYKQYRMNLFT